MPKATPNPIHCPVCASIVSPKAQACMQCGHPLRQTPEEVWLPVLVVLIGGVWVFAIAAIIGR